MSNYDYWNEDYIEHYGTKGQKWGVRKYQYEDGSLTPEGKRRYRDGVGSTSSGASYDHSKFDNGSRVYRISGPYTYDSKGNKTHHFVQPVSRETVPGLTESWLKYMDRAGNYLGNLENTNATNAQRAVKEAERNELMNERAANTSFKMAERAVKQEKEAYERQQQYNKELAKAAKHDYKLEKRNQQDYNKKTRADATLKTNISVIDKQYSPGKVNVLNEIKKSYGNALNTYVSGLNTIGSWASNLFKK